MWLDARMSINVTTLSRALHDGMCRSLDWCDRASHAKRWRTVARDVLSAECAATALHQRVCPAEIDPTFPNGCGIDRERHIAHLNAWLDRQG
jgi:hypothetical protein